ncbi:MAG: hypothetical protein EOP09_00430 [Proteobacteria bacterium]|nr:MAG: hypothetical protein EOP09_00430 [Pseudomonadota bacterium]
MLIADSDCVWYGTCARIAEATLKSGLGTMTINYPAEKVVNGLSREGMRDLMPIIDLKKPLDVPAYCAGEAIGLTSCAIVELSQQARSVFERILAHHQNDLGFVCEEAHMLSMLSADLTAQSGALNQLTKRIWTAQRYRSTTLADLNLDLWHLPAEKRSGFLDLYNHLKGTHEEWIRCSAGDRQERLKELMGVPTKSPTKSLKDFVRASARRFNQCVRK